MTICAKTSLLGLVLVSLASCSSGDSSSSTPTSSGSAALQGPLVFVHNGTEATTSVIALKGDTGNSVILKMGKGVAETGHPDGAYDGNAPGDMQFSEGEWVFVNVGAGNGVSLIDPLSGAKPIFEDILQVGRRPAHIYRDPTDGQVMWTMIDGDPTTGLDDVAATIPDTSTVVDCSATGGGAVTIIHNSHIPSGGLVPEIIGKVCLYAKGHKVTAFSRGTGIPKRAFVSSEVSGEIAVIDNEPTIGAAPNPDYLNLINRIDLCNPAKETDPLTCNPEDASLLTTAFTPNNSTPHGIRFSIASNKVYSIQEGYHTIVEIDPMSLNVTRTLDLAGLPYTSYGITPDGKYLFLRGVDTATNNFLGKMGIVDLVNNPLDPFVITSFADLLNIVPAGFKFAPDGKRLYMLASNTATGSAAQLGSQLKNILLEFDTTGFPAQPTLVRNISLEVTAGNHSFDIYADGPAGAGSAKYVVVSNGTGQNSVSIINATDSSVPKQNVPVGVGAGTIMIYYPDAALNNNQASS